MAERHVIIQQTLEIARNSETAIHRINSIRRQIIFLRSARSYAADGGSGWLSLFFSWDTEKTEKLLRNLSICKVACPDALTSSLAFPLSSLPSGTPEGWLLHEVRSSGSKNFKRLMRLSPQNPSDMIFRELCAAHPDTTTSGSSFYFGFTTSMDRLEIVAPVSFLSSSAT